MSDTLHPGELGNILIKYNDRWRGNYYLREDLFFTTDRSAAGRFYLLKSGDTTILNGDRVSVHLGSKTLVVTPDSLRLIDRDQINRNISTYIISNNTDNVMPISYESPLSLISDRDSNMYLKYDWVRKINSDTFRDEFESFPTSLRPQLTNVPFIVDDNTFKFLLERAEDPITRSELTRPVLLSNATATITAPNKRLESIDGYKGLMIIVLLMIMLALCVVVSKS